MNNPFRFIVVAVFVTFALSLAAFSADRPVAEEGLIRQVVVVGDGAGYVVLDDRVLATVNDGLTWRALAIPLLEGEIIAGMASQSGRLVLVTAVATDAGLFYRSSSDGDTWDRHRIVLTRADREDAAVDRIEFVNGSTLRITLASSSNFRRTATYATGDNGATWRRTGHFVEPNTETVGRSDSAHYGSTVWTIETAGRCEGAKRGCWQETRLTSGGREITPPEIANRNDLVRAAARLEAADSVFAQPPGGTTRVSLQRGFDKCTAAPTAQMQTWWDNSWFYDANIYMSGRNRACSQPQLSAAWVEAVTAQGWGLIPTVVGYQSPCSVSTSSVKHSSDPVVAEQQGRGEADIAVADAINLGLTAGSILYYDMERYDDVSGTGACSTPTKAFLKGWTDRVHELGYQSGVYGSPTNAVGDWLNIPEQSRMDAVWLARWDNVMSVWTYNSPSPVVPDTAWGNHQRIKQWQAPHNETWGGVTFNIDGNIADGPVASALIAKNKRADYDGDGMSDVSVWRPSTGVWYVSHSATPTYLIQTFGIPTDTITPGDYDGDGKTDLAVWRPSDGVWHFYSRSIYTANQFGTAGDVPVAADYDGDGRTDIAVWRPATGVWYIRNSFDSRGTSFTIQTFGLSGDIPVPEDFDGDGKADLAVYRPSEGVWYLLKSTEGFAAIQFGLNGDYPAQADYDGDGRSDLGIFRPSTGVWYLYRSQEGITSLQFGLTGDIPSVGDYDGDGKYDVAVFRPATGIWYLNRSSAGFSASQFGLNGDRPVESGYLPPN